MAKIAVNGAQLYYEITGTSDAPIVLVHGSWGDHHNWDPVVPALARSFKVLTYDRRGHSQSTRGDGAGTLQQDAEDLAGLLEALDFAPAYIVGNSFGAAITLRLASQRPELFRGMAVHEPPLFGLLEGEAMLQGPLAAMNQRVGAVVDVLRAGDTAAGARLFVETVAFGPGAWERLPETTRQTFITNAPTWLEELDDPDWLHLDLRKLAGFAKPTLLTRGERSAPFFPAVVAQIARAMPGATQHLFSGAGHVPHLEQPDAYVAAISSFVERASAANEGWPPTGVAEAPTARPLNP